MAYNSGNATHLVTPMPQPATASPAATGPHWPGGRNPREKYKLTIYKLGIIEVVLGVVCCILWLVSMVLAMTAPMECYEYLRYEVYHRTCYNLYFEYTYISSGLWGGLFLIFTGVLGICTKKKTSPCMYYSNMTLSIITSLAMGVVIIISSITPTRYEASRYPDIKPPHIILAVVGFVALVVCITHSAYCCAGSCTVEKQHGTVVYASPHQYVQLPNGQLMPLQAQPMLSHPVMMMSAMDLQPSPSCGMSPGVAAPALPKAAKQLEAEMQQYPGDPPTYDESCP